MSLEPLNARVARLEETVRAQDLLVRQLFARLARGGDPRNPRLARTISLGSYPTRTDGRQAWEIVFVDASFVEDAGDLAPIARDDRQAEPFAVARNIHNDPFVPQGTLLVVWRDNGRWWFDYRDEVQVGVLQGTLEPGGSVSVQPYLAGSPAPGGAVNCYDKLGVMAGTAGFKCLFEWQRETGEYWILNMECEEAISSTSLTPIPEARQVFPASLVRRRPNRGGLAHTLT